MGEKREAKDGGVRAYGPIVAARLAVRLEVSQTRVRNRLLSGFYRTQLFPTRQPVRRSVITRLCT
ncbi:MAG: hypothetical protein ABSF66_11975 [Terriglobales bacterium]|jgi:hypothetical protein